MGRSAEVRDRGTVCGEAETRGEERGESGVRTEGGLRETPVHLLLSDMCRAHTVMSVIETLNAYNKYLYNLYFPHEINLSLSPSAGRTVFNLYLKKKSPPAVTNYDGC